MWIGPIPHATEQLVRRLELKLVAKQAGFSRIKPEGKQHVVMEPPMEVAVCLQRRQGGGTGAGRAQARKAVGEFDRVVGVFAGGDRRATG